MVTLPTVDDPPAKSTALPPYHVEIKFGPRVTSDTQGRLMLAWERLARETMGVPVELYKHVMEDDLKRRRDMTTEDRQRL